MLVRLDNIHKAYAKNEVLSGVSLSIDERQVIAIQGGNGSGKSTLLRMIAGIEQPSKGKIIRSNQELVFGYVPERFPKNLRFTPSEYLNHIGKINGLSREYLNHRVPELIHQFRLEEFDHQWITNLSKGNIQKVGITQAILRKPDLLLLDEPLSGLDEHAQKELLKVLEALKANNTTILLTYHESNIFKGLIDNFYYLYHGELSDEKPFIKAGEYKLLEILNIDANIVEAWEEVDYMDHKIDRLLLYVHSNSSDDVLLKVLQLKGSIAGVTTLQYKGEESPYQ